MNTMTAGTNGRTRITTEAQDTIEAHLDTLNEIERHADDLQLLVTEFDELGRVGLARAQFLHRCERIAEIATELQILKDEIEDDLRDAGGRR